MPIIFRSVPIAEPFTFESLGNDWNQDPVSRPRGYPFYHYLQSERGTGRIHTPEKTYVLHENEGLPFSSFVRHSYEKETPEWYTCFASFTGTMENTISQMLGNRQSIPIEASTGKRIASLIDICVSECAARPIDEKRLSIHCYSLLLNFIDGAHSRMLTDEPLYRSYVAPILREIEKNYSQELSVKELSRQVYITPQYLSRLFQKYLGCSTYEYLTLFRISRAKELLITHPKLEIQEIAYRSGYGDASHFIVMFKRPPA